MMLNLIVNDLYPLPSQMLKHTKTVCTHQVRECDYKDLGCTYKVHSHSIYSLPTYIIMHSCNYVT